jgi:hypothetical protein
VDQNEIAAAEVEGIAFGIFDGTNVKKHKYQISPNEFRISGKNDIQKLRPKIAQQYFPGHSFNKDVVFKIIFPKN